MRDVVANLTARLAQESVISSSARETRRLCLEREVPSLPAIDEVCGLPTLAIDPSATIEAASMEALGSGPISISVQQIGDYAASRPIQIIIN